MKQPSDLTKVVVEPAELQLNFLGVEEAALSRLFLYAVSRLTVVSGPLNSLHLEAGNLHKVGKRGRLLLKPVLRPRNRLFPDPFIGL